MKPGKRKKKKKKEEKVTSIESQNSNRPRGDRSNEDPTETSRPSTCDPVDQQVPDI